ncbi:MAG: hypothetical protein DRN12_05975 [Thermoplasmata archaeon]|nr:MAG: hypothetical protein DRN12_05975 [Thermoplasmata archaeon]
MKKIIIWLILLIFLIPLLPQSVIAGTPIKWEDDFLDESRIDLEKSYNYTVNKTTGIALMKNTCRAWHNADWTRMKKIDIINDAGRIFREYILDLTVYYDSDMKTDFSDLRFTDEDGNYLAYWIAERNPGESAHVLVRIPYIPLNGTSIYMFYGNPYAEDEGDFDLIFTWEDRTDPDIMISYKNYLEGAWDPDVAYGGGRFLVAWEERLGPEDLPDHMERTIPCQIHGRTYNSDGKDPYPTDDLDIYISTSDPNDGTHHSENPSIAFGGGKFLVVWEENPSVDPALRFESDIKAAFVTVDGIVTKRFTVCNAPSLQCDPCVAYDEESGHFFIVWEDARSGTENYDVYGRIYDTSGNPVTDDFQVTSEPNCQDEPWVCSDNSGNFLVVYENGYDPETGPFSLEAERFDSYGNKLGSTVDIIDGTSNQDNIFPAAVFSEETQRYCITWNDADLSEGRWRGNIWGKILDRYGETIHDSFIIQEGVEYVRTDVIPYLDTMFFVSYDGSSDLWGRLISSDGTVETEAHALSDGSSQHVDWNNLAVGEGKIFATWEDERDQASDYPDAFGSVWHIYHSTGSPDVSYSFGVEQKLITEAVVVSKIIDPGEGFIEWYKFNASYSTPVGSISFDILNEDGTEVLLGNVNPGEDISFLPEQPIRLRARFSRSTPIDSPLLDKWSITWIGNDMDPPWTICTMSPEEPDGENGWYTVSVKFTLEAHDDISPIEEITTYYCIDDGPQQIYDPLYKPSISTDGAEHRFEYWSVDAARNEEEHNIIYPIKIDRTPPLVTIDSPEWGKVDPGDVTVKVTVEEATSGVNRVEIWFNGGLAAVIEGERPVYTWQFTAERGQQYDIEVRAYDNAGLMGNAYVSVKCPRLKIIDILIAILEFLLEKLGIHIPYSLTHHPYILWERFIDVLR